MKLTAAVSVILLASSMASAQEFFIGNDIFDMVGRPVRDRLERFQSARTDALQMRLAVDDESDQLTLENWGDNRADIRAGNSSLKAEANVTSGEAYSSGKWNEEGKGLGVYGRFGRAEFEGLFLNQKSDKVNSSSSDEFNRASGGAALAFGGDKLSYGLHANVNYMGDEGWEEVDTQNSLGAALAYRADIFELGATADFLGRGIRKDSTNYDVSPSGPQFGLQALVKPAEGFKAGVRALMGKLSASDAHNGATAYKGYETDANELGARLEWKASALPLTVGAEYAKYFYDPEYTASGVYKKNESNFDSYGAGAALRLLDGRVLVGAEARFLKMAYTYTNGASVTESENKANAISGGAEFWVLPRVALRGSYRIMHTDSGSSETDGNTLAAGLGYKGEKYTLDAAVRRDTQDADAADPDVYTDVRVVFGMKF